VLRVRPGAAVARHGACIHGLGGGFVDIERGAHGTAFGYDGAGENAGQSLRVRAMPVS
jgi:hypothetical protein